MAGKHAIPGCRLAGLITGQAVDDVQERHPSSPRRILRAMASEAVSGRVSEAMCGVTVTRGCAQ